MKTLIMLAVLGGWQTIYQTRYQRQCTGNGCSMVPVSVPVQVWVPESKPTALKEQPKSTPVLFRFY